VRLGRNTTVIAAWRRTCWGGLELCRIAAKIRRLTPVPMVAMDCGLLESRLDRLEATDHGGSGWRWFEPGGSIVAVRLSERT
jgi:hypothetical protein